MSPARDSKATDERSLRLVYYFYFYEYTCSRARASKAADERTTKLIPFFLVQQGCLRVGVSRCGLAAVVGGGVSCFVGIIIIIIVGG